MNHLLMYTLIFFILAVISAVLVYFEYSKWYVDSNATTKDSCDNIGKDAESKYTKEGDACGKWDDRMKLCLKGKVNKNLADCEAGTMVPMLTLLLTVLSSILFMIFLVVYLQSTKKL